MMMMVWVFCFDVSSSNGLCLTMTVLVIYYYKLCCTKWCTTSFLLLWLIWEVGIGRFRGRV